MLSNASPPRNQRARHWGGGSVVWLAALSHPLGGPLWRPRALQPHSLGGGGRAGEAEGEGRRGGTELEEEGTGRKEKGLVLG